ncbi:gametocyte-specific factor 1 [Apteryx mantelli]|uniref:Gametocyte-specific factor 1 n=1 Tax=Apteryx mantelli TaxID=2696672 RepID=A0ABM4FYJ1_9AVES
MEPGRLLQCPYDQSHRVRAARFPYHLVKCQRSHEQLARSLATCPYNARHKVPRAELRSHAASCADNRQPQLFRELSPGAPAEPPADAAATAAPPCHEDWEADAAEAAPPFVLDFGAAEQLPAGPSSPPPPPAAGSAAGPR